MINPVRALWLRPRLIVAIVLGLVLVWALPSAWELSTRLLTAWCLSVAVYIVMAVVLMTRLDRDSLQRKASKLDDTSLEMLLLCGLATAASVVAVGVELSGIKSLPAASQGVHLGLTVATLVCSWSFIQVVFSIHYAHMYYGDDEASRKAGDPYRGGLDFGGDDEPDFWDFLYFTVSVGATSQTSDTEVTSRTMRRIVLAQSVLSFFFNTAVLAFGINIAASLLN